MDEMIRALEYSVRFLDQAVGDLSEDEMVGQPPGVPNHATWTLGHVVHACHAKGKESVTVFV